MTPLYQCYPGTVSLTPATYFVVIGEMLSSLRKLGFRRFFFVNSHGGNSPVQAFISQWLTENEDSEVVLYWWCAPKTLREVHAVDRVATHGSWMESFEPTKVQGVSPPSKPKPVVEFAKFKQPLPTAVEALLGDGSYGGDYEKDAVTMERIWQTAVEEAVSTFETIWCSNGVSERMHDERQF